MPTVPLRYPRTVAVLTTMHGKEAVMKPILERELEVVLGLALGVDTDRFGSFSREYERAGNQLDAARAKVRAGFDYAPLARIGIASEGSFGPHPSVPFLPIARELVLLTDREHDLELVGHDVSTDTNYRSAVVRSVEAAVDFARLIGFPDHGVILTAAQDQSPAPGEEVFKSICTDAELVDVSVRILRDHGAAFIESDMRAHRNPTRMAAIERATRDLIRRFHSRCPACSWPGFDVTDRAKGLPCSNCGAPTLELRAEIRRCARCNRQEEHDLSCGSAGDPAWCPCCNP